MLFVFKSISDVNIQLTEIGQNNMNITFKSIDNDLIAAQVIDEAKRLAITTKTVLIRGESGTGKELLAKAIHTFSDRAGHCFINVNCDGTYRKQLEESLFGDEQSNQIVGGLGKLQLAHKGTIYFYKIDQMPIYLQKRLAEILRNKTIVQAGMRSIEVDLRMIFSTSEDLESLVHNGLFEDELYYRISENTITIPPLREDKVALRKLLTSSTKFFKEKYNKEDLIFDTQAFKALLNYRWPGNGKELDKVMDFIVYSCTGTVTLEDLTQLNVIELEDNKLLSIRELERDSIARLLASNRNRDDVANKLGISRATLYRKIKKYNL
jgi:DNA-binding NtrC family response regulator